MNIGVDIRCLLPPHKTGVGEFTIELLYALFKIDNKNQYYLYSNSLSPAKKYFEEKENIHIFSTSFPNKLFSFSEAVFKAPKIDWLIRKQFHLNRLDYFLSPHLNFTSLSRETKHILLIHDLTFELFPEFLTFKQRIWHSLTTPKKQSRGAHVVFTPSENTKRDIINIYKIDEQKVKVLYPGVSEVFSSDNQSSKQNNYNLPQNYFLFLGTIEPRKNIPAVIKAFELAYNELTEPHHLVIAGAPGWKNREITDLISSSNLKNKIIQLGYIPERDKPGLYRNAKIFVYPSFYEGFGFPVLEALTSRLPVITSNRSSLVEVTGRNAVLIDPYRPEQIAKAMVDLINKPSVKANLIENGAAQARKFTWEQAAHNLLTHLS